MVEYMNGGSLQNLVDAGGCEDEGTLANIAKQSLNGLAYLHASSHLHRDLKPANMLINHQGEVKLSDFGIIRKLDSKDEAEGGMLDPGQQKATDGKLGTPLASAHTFVGTVTFMSPERINGESYSTPSDVWSLGLSLMTCALGKTPLRTNQGYWTLLKCVRDDDPPEMPSDGRWSNEIRDFVAKCLKKDPAHRATCAELLEHPFVRHATMDSEDADAEAESRLRDRALAELNVLLATTLNHLTVLQREGRALPGLCNPGTPVVDAMAMLFQRRGLGRLAQQLDLPEPTVRTAIDDYVQHHRQKL